jgi:hypothetical protein
MRRTAQGGVIKSGTAWLALKYANSEILPYFRKIFLVITLIVSILCIPTYLVHTVIRVEENAFTVDISYWSKKNGCRWFKLNLWIIGVILKSIPCFLLLWFTLALMVRLHKNNMKRAMLLQNGSRKRRQNYDRTTLTLIVMLGVFLITELPQGFLACLNAIYTTDAHDIIYYNLANVLDLLSLINCYVGFIAYSFLCSKYRETFIMMILTAMAKSPKNVRIETTCGNTSRGLLDEVIDINTIGVITKADL